MTDAIRPHIDDEDDSTAVLAGALVAATGDQDALARMRDRLDSLPTREQRSMRIWLLEILRQYDVGALSGWVQEVLSDPRSGTQTRYWGTLTALSLDPEGGLASWERQLGTDPSYADRVRYGLLLLAAETPLPSTPFDLIERGLPEDDELVRAMARVGRERSNDRQTPEALIDLLGIGHLQASDWVMSTLERPSTPSALDAVVYARLIDEIETMSGGPTEHIARAIEATKRLYESDPGAVLGRLRSVPDDGIHQEVLLLGLLDVRGTAPGRAALSLPRQGSGRADTLALLLIGRLETELEPADLDRLGMIAAGGGRTSAGLRTQAAWLYLEKGDRARVALDAVIADLP